MGPRDVHTPARYGRAFAALGAEGHGGFRAGLVEDVKPALHPGLADSFWIKLLRTGKQEVAVRQVERACEAVMWKMGGEIANAFRREGNLHCVAESFREKENLLSVVRPIGALAEPR